jgi:hypothetical protein
MMDIQLNFINQSNDANNAKVVIFQKNVAADFAERPVAWLVIPHCERGNNHPFVFPTSMAVSAGDDDGNYTPQMPAEHGQLLSVNRTESCETLQMTAANNGPTELGVLNATTAGTISANIYRASRLLATKPSIAPQQKAVFQFNSSIWIGVVSEIEQGEIMIPAIVSTLNTELSLLGIASADIVMTGGGSGKHATAFEFSLNEIVMA